MHTVLIQQVFDLSKLNNPLIAVESPLQERLGFLTNLARMCADQNINCYLWTLEDDHLHQLLWNRQDLNLLPTWPNTNSKNYWHW